MPNQNTTVRRRVRSATAETPCLALAGEKIARTPVAHGPLRVTDLPIASLREPKRKLRRYGKRQLQALRASIEEFGMLRPVLVDNNGTIIAGVAVWLAAKELKHETIPVICIEHLTPEQVRFYRIAVERRGVNGAALISVTLRAAFDLVSARDGSSHTIEAYGEAPIREIRQPARR